MTGDFSPEELSPAEAELGVRTLPRGLAAFEPEYLAHPYLPAGKCVLLDADGGTGKTSLALAWAASLSRGLHPTTFARLPGGPVRTLYLHRGEDADEELETVYRANGGVAGRIRYAGSRLGLDKPGCDLVARAIRGGDYRLVVLDALMYFLEGAVRDANTAMDVNPAIQRLNAIARATGCTFLNVRHTRKGALGAEASALGMGSVAFRNAHRGQLVARFHPDREAHRGLVVVTDEKGSLMVPRGDPFMFRRVGHEIQYVRGVENPFAAPGSAPPPSRVPPSPNGKLDAAQAALALALGPGWALARDCEDALSPHYSDITLRRAKAALGLISRRRGEVWWWVRPDALAVFDRTVADDYDPLYDR